MAESIISEGKTTNEAIENGLKQLKVSKSQVDIKVLEEEKKSFFSILAPRVVKVQLTLKERGQAQERPQKEVKRKQNENEEDIKEAVNKAKEFMTEFIEKQPVKDIKWEVNQKEYDIEITIDGGNEISYLIGYRGETMYALQTVISSILNKNLEDKIKVYVDVNGYRAKRARTLEELANKVSKTVLRTGKAIALEPMTAYERKIIHSALQGNDKITTFSKGEEPFRKIVIDLKR